MKEIEDTTKYRPIEQIDVSASQDIVDLMKQFSNMGFNAKRLAQACQIYEDMCKDKECVKFFALSGALVPVGLQKVVYDFINEGFIDVLVTTGANLTHDVGEALGDHQNTLIEFLMYSCQTKSMKTWKIGFILLK
ncbi:MAG: deoxyhypusine synthase family protein [Promethearchaeota archaeon]